MAVAQTNLVYDPDTTATTRYTAAGGALSIVSGKLRLTATGGVAAYFFPTYPPGSSTRFPAAEGLKYAWRVTLTNPEAFAIWIAPTTFFYTSGGANVTSTAETPIFQLAAGASTTIHAVGVVPAGATIAGAYPTILLYSSAAFALPAAGTRVDATQFAVFGGVSAANIVAGAVPYYSGATPDTNLFIYDWVSTANDSSSTLSYPTLSEQTIPDPYGSTVANNSKAHMTVVYRGGWLG